MDLSFHYYNFYIKNIIFCPSQHIDRKYIVKLVNSNYFVDYVEAVLLDERSSLNIPVIYNFLSTYFPKV